MKKKNVLYSPRIAQLKKQKRKIFKIKVGFFVFLFLLLLTGLIFLSHWQRINLDLIEVKGNKIVETELIKKIVQEELVGKYFWVFPKSNFLLYPKILIKEKLAENYKRLKNISFEIKNFKTLEISVTEYDGKYLYCGGITPPLTSDLRCYFMDQDGYIFDEAPYFSGNVYFRFYGDLGNTQSKNLNQNFQVPIMETPVSNYFQPNNFQKIVFLVENVKAMGLNPEYFFVNIVDQEGSIYLASNVFQIDGPKIIFKMDADFNKLAENLQAAINQDPLKTNLKEKYDSLLYIDLRYGNKVYYKF